MATARGYNPPPPRISVIMSQLIEFTNNHPILVSGTIAMALAVIFNELRLRTQGLTAVSAVQAVQLINQGARVIDVRDQAQFAAGHIVDAMHIPAAELSTGKHKRLKTGKSFILVCADGSRSRQCADTLRKAGYESTFSLKGGLASWTRENLPVVSSAKNH